MAKWILVTADGVIHDGICEMPEPQAMGYNQTRALAGMSARWEEYNPATHGTPEQVKAAVEYMDEQEIIHATGEGVE